jgi:hypothetical protein
MERPRGRTSKSHGAPENPVITVALWLSRAKLWGSAVIPCALGVYPRQAASPVCSHRHFKAMKQSVRIHYKLGERQPVRRPPGPEPTALCPLRLPLSQMLDNFRKLMDVLSEGKIGRAKAEKTTTKLLTFVDGAFATSHAPQPCNLTPTPAPGEELSAITQMYNIAFESIMSQTKNRNDGLWCTILPHPRYGFL